MDRNNVCFPLETPMVSSGAMKTGPCEEDFHSIQSLQFQFRGL